MKQNWSLYFACIRRHSKCYWYLTWRVPGNRVEVVSLPRLYQETAKMSWGTLPIPPDIRRVALYLPCIRKQSKFHRLPYLACIREQRKWKWSLYPAGARDLYRTTSLPSLLTAHFDRRPVLCFIASSPGAIGSSLTEPRLLYEALHVIIVCCPHTIYPLERTFPR